jgi:hypothetical protein
MNRLKAYKFLSGESDVAAILEGFASQPTRTGGYYYLHQDVPVYFPDLMGIENTQLSRYVSHIVCGSNTNDLPGFRVIAKFGNIDIRKQLNPPAHFQKLDHYSRQIPMPGRLKSSIQPRP